ncbi:hypothetical protein F4775DRAFT_503180 [Biscogniauxia sp. FL1348]|nr:hypothetical protein F4775DRAFT_503180 [Biscogniauxia sp. FL1348]
MAPTGPRKGAAPTGPRNTRASTGGGKPNTRGGVSKRRGAGATKVDRDGDLEMDGPAASSRAPRNPKRTDNSSNPPASAPRAPRSTGTTSRPPRTSVKAQQIIQRALNGGSGGLASRATTGMAGSTRTSRTTRQTNGTQAITLKVEGLQSSRAAGYEGGGLKELLTFLERKAQSVGKITRHIRIKKSQVNGDFVYITASKEDAEEILKLNNFQWAGTTLTISESTQGMPAPGEAALSSSAIEVKDQLRSILSLRYDVNTKLLNLSALGEDAGLNQMGFFSGENKPEKLFRALMAVCEGLFKTAQAKRDAVVSVSLAGNSVDDVIQIMSLADTFPDLINLDLSRNQFKDLKGLQKWRHRLRNIETLLLNDNPIESTNPNYKTELITWFPKLQNLSGIQVRTPEQVAAEKAASLPKPLPQHGADFRDLNRVGEGFITEFMQLYDTDRHNLAAKYYDDQSTFSIAVNTHSPHAPDVRAPSWGAYIKFSRNHTKITHAPARFQRLFTGTNLIQNAWKQLPPTRHPDLASQFDKYIVDCHPINGLADPSGQSQNGVDGIIITIHGEYEDQEPESMKTTKRSFSRTFVIGPGAPGRNPIRVVSDLLSVKAFTPVPTATEPIPVPNAQDGSEIQQQMVIELCKQTGMTPEYSKLCLDGAAWNFDQALVSFNEKRAQLPAEAFATPM